MLKRGWSPAPVLFLALAFGLSVTAFVLARQIMVARLDPSAEPRGILTEPYGLYATHQLSDLSDLPDAEQRSRATKAFAALQQQLRINPAAPMRWTRLAFVAQTALEEPRATIVDALTKSYLVGPISAGAAPMRISLALVYWNSLPQETQRAVELEARTICKQLPAPCRRVVFQVEGVRSAAARARFERFTGKSLKPPPET